MVDIQWGLANGSGFQNALATGVQLGQHVAQRREQNALMQQRQQQLDQQAQQAQRQAEQQQSQQRRADLPMIGKLLDYAKDETTYQQARQFASQNGIDVSGLPQQFDPNWLASQRAMVQALQSPQGQEALSTAGKIATDMGLQPGTPEFSAKVSEIFQLEQQKLIPTAPGGGVARFDPTTGRTEMVIVPNDGSRTAGASAGGVQEGATATNPQTGEQIVFRGGQWVPMGGGVSNGTGTFRP